MEKYVKNIITGFMTVIVVGIMGVIGFAGTTAVFSRAVSIGMNTIAKNILMSMVGAIAVCGSILVLWLIGSGVNKQLEPQPTPVRARRATR